MTRILEFGDGGIPIPKGEFGELIEKLRANGARFTFEGDAAAGKLCAFDGETGALLMEADLSNAPPGSET